MSLGDYLRYLRAVHGGESTMKIAQALGLPSPWPINEIEQRYRKTGDDELIRKLADYYGVPVEELLWRRERSRKALSIFLGQAADRNMPVSLLLRTGERLEGTVEWFDLGALCLNLADGSGHVIVQRHIIDDWGFAERS